LARVRGFRSAAKVGIAEAAGSRILIAMPAPDYVVAYNAHLGRLVAAHGREAAMELVVGGEYAQIGFLESSALIRLGLRPEHTLVDIGCGSGRLPFALREYLTGSFVGTDILDDALAYAARDGRRAVGTVEFGQSVAVLTKAVPAPTAGTDP
jgi:hypothetical protein